MWMGIVRSASSPVPTQSAARSSTISDLKSKFWSKTCIFVVEDDPQDGFDHVDGHRSLCLVASPYTKRGAVVHNFRSQEQVLVKNLYLRGRGRPARRLRPCGWASFALPRRQSLHKARRGRPQFPISRASSGQKLVSSW